MLHASFTFAMLVSGFIALEAIRANEDALSTSHPPPPSIYVPEVFTNSTVLEDACRDACHGGVCVQNAVSGITRCMNCTDGFTLSSGSSHCVNTTECALWPWCSNERAVLINSIHQDVVALSPNNTAVLPSAPGVLTYVPILGETGAHVARLFNLYYEGRRLLEARDVRMNPSLYWDDELVTSTLKAYKVSLMDEYKSYVTEMKSKVCVGTTWVPFEGECVSPETSQLNW